MNRLAIVLLLATVLLPTGCGPAARPADPAAPAPAAPASGPALVGTWEGCDGRLIEFTDEGDEIVGRYVALGDLGQYGFEIGEPGYRFTEQADGSYVGQVKWRFNDGRQQWRDAAASVAGDTYEDDSSDSCSKTLERVPPGA